MSKDAKVALISAAAVIIAAVIGGLFQSGFFKPHINPTPTPVVIITPTSTPTPSPTPMPTADQAINTFCSALNYREYDTAYNQLSSQAQQNISEQAFATSYAVHCASFSAWTQIKDGWEITVTMLESSGLYPQNPFCTYDLYQNSNGEWKINNPDNCRAAL